MLSISLIKLIYSIIIDNICEFFLINNMLNIIINVAVFKYKNLIYLN